MPNGLYAAFPGDLGSSYAGWFPRKNILTEYRREVYHFSCLIQTSPFLLYYLYKRSQDTPASFSGKENCFSITELCPTLCDPMDGSMPSLSLAFSWSLPKFMCISLVMPSCHLILWCPLLLPSVFPSIRVFSTKSALCIRWPKYWSFSFNISPSNEYSGLISFRID